jgi:hypothetical protein
VTPSAWAARRDTGLVTAAGVAAVVMVMAVAGTNGRLDAAGIATLLTVSALAVLALAFAVRRWGRATIAELQRGYTTAPFTMGRFWMGAASDGPLTNGWVGWDFSATWVLRVDGRVVSSPTGDTDPPGLYPSPRRDGALELWTGCQWSGYVPPPASLPER